MHTRLTAVLVMFLMPPLRGIGPTETAPGHTFFLSFDNYLRLLA
jgi:CxxC motif-containing protein (DUF1111 family)